VLSESQNTETPGWSRRFVLKGMAAGVASGIATGSACSSTTTAALPAAGKWSGFDAKIRKEFARQGNVGGAVALVSASKRLYTATIGRRSLGQRERVDESTHFAVGSTTKSMSSLLAATYVDRGKLDWDQKAVDAWPDFRAPTDALTATLRVRDLFGMSTGLTSTAANHLEYPSAADLLQSLVNLPVAAPPNTKFFYNNIVYAAGGYLPLLAQHAKLADLQGAYAVDMLRSVFGPAAMTGARIASDPRGLVTNYVRGNSLDLRGSAIQMPYGTTGSAAPAGGALASLNDVAAYVQLQLRGGVSVHGVRVVSESNLAECWRPHVTVAIDPELDPDLTSAGYGMGWLNHKYSDGTTLIWHNGAIDGFSAFIGFLPGHDLGLVVLNNMDSNQTGFLFFQYVLNVFLGEQFGLNKGVPAKVQALYDSRVRDLRALGAKARAVQPAKVTPWLGYYERGYQMVLDGGDLQMRLGSRIWPIKTLPDGSYLFSAGAFVDNKVGLTRDPDGASAVDVGTEHVRRTNGLD